MLTVRKRFLTIALSAAAFGGLPASAFILSRVDSQHPGLGSEGLADRGRCELNNLEKREMNMVEANPIYQVTPITLEDPRIPQAKNHIQDIADSVNGVARPQFGNVPTVNYWAQTKGTEPRKLLLSIQDGKVVAKDRSTEAQTLVNILDKNCFRLNR